MVLKYFMLTRSRSEAANHIISLRARLCQQELCYVVGYRHLEDVNTEGDARIVKAQFWGQKTKRQICVKVDTDRNVDMS